MTPREEEFLRSIVAGVQLPRRVGSNPLDNSYWATLIRGALKGLETVASYSMEWKLVALVKLFQSWLADKEAEQAAQSVRDFGYSYELSALDEQGGRPY